MPNLALASTFYCRTHKCYQPCIEDTSKRIDWSFVSAVQSLDMSLGVPGGEGKGGGALDQAGGAGLEGGGQVGGAGMGSNL